eukprot:TRINITY_DN27687_c0_g1_i1.p1 TRINITY_DN27687_c0_g1~~TRINITY_DN27687_c0_g1_i1.p1  ORF type:complete len:1440 (+),score=339.94 TRINITY_DN27687_c0_g1_i1:137-4456(+)
MTTRRRSSAARSNTVAALGEILRQKIEIDSDSDRESAPAALDSPKHASAVPSRMQLVQQPQSSKRFRVAGLGVIVVLRFRAAGKRRASEQALQKARVDDGKLVWSSEERAFHGQALNSVPLMLKTQEVVRFFLEDATVNNSISSIHKVKSYAIRVCWREFIKPLQEEVRKGKQEYALLKARFQEGRMSYLKEISSLRDHVRFRPDPTSGLPPPDPTMFWGPEQMMTPDELEFMTKALQEMVKVIFDTNPNVTKTIDFGQMDRMKEKVESEAQESFKKQLAKANAKIRELEDEVSELAQQEHTRKFQMRFKRASIGAFGSISAAEQLRHADADSSTKREVEEELQKSKDEIKELEKKCHGLEWQVVGVKEELDYVTEERQRLEQAIEVFEEDRRSLQQQLEQERKDLLSSKLKCTSLSKAVASAQAEEAEGRKREKQLHQQLEEQLQQLEELPKLREQLQQAQNRLKQQAAEMEAMKSFEAWLPPDASEDKDEEATPNRRDDVLPSPKSGERPLAEARKQLASVDLCAAAAKGDIQQVRQLIAQKKARDVNACNYDQRTALHLASSTGSLDTVVAIVSDLGASVNPMDRWGGTPLDDALRHGFHLIAEFLRSKGGELGATSVQQPQAQIAELEMQRKQQEYQCQRLEQQCAQLEQQCQNLQELLRIQLQVRCEEEVDGAERMAEYASTLGCNVDRARAHMEALRNSATLLRDGITPKAGSSVSTATVLQQRAATDDSAPEVSLNVVPVSNPGIPAPDAATAANVPTIESKGSPPAGPLADSASEVSSATGSHGQPRGSTDSDPEVVRSGILASSPAVEQRTISVNVDDAPEVAGSLGDPAMVRSSAQPEVAGIASELEQVDPEAPEESPLQRSSQSFRASRYSPAKRVQPSASPASNTPSEDGERTAASSSTGSRRVDVEVEASGISPDRVTPDRFKKLEEDVQIVDNQLQTKLKDLKELQSQLGTQTSQRPSSAFDPGQAERVLKLRQSCAHLTQEKRCKEAKLLVARVSSSAWEQAQLPAERPEVLQPLTPQSHQANCSTCGQLQKELEATRAMLSKVQQLSAELVVKYKDSVEENLEQTSILAQCRDSMGDAARCVAASQAVQLLSGMPQDPQLSKCAEQLEQARIKSVLSGVEVATAEGFSNWEPETRNGRDRNKGKAKLIMELRKLGNQTLSLSRSTTRFKSSNSSFQGAPAPVGQQSEGSSVSVLMTIRSMTSKPADDGEDEKAAYQRLVQPVPPQGPPPQDQPWRHFSPEVERPTNPCEERRRSRSKQASKGPGPDAVPPATAMPTGPPVPPVPPVPPTPASSTSFVYRGTTVRRASFNPPPTVSTDFSGAAVVGSRMLADMENPDGSSRHGSPRQSSPVGSATPETGSPVLSPALRQSSPIRKVLGASRTRSPGTRSPGEPQSRAGSKGSSGIVKADLTLLPAIHRRRSSKP